MTLRIQLQYVSSFFLFGFASFSNNQIVLFVFLVISKKAFLIITIYVSMNLLNQLPKHNLSHKVHTTPNKDSLLQM